MAANETRCEWCEEMVRPDHDSYDCGATMRDKWKKAAARVAAADRLAAAVRGFHPCDDETCTHPDAIDTMNTALRAYDAGVDPVVAALLAEGTPEATAVLSDYLADHPEVPTVDAPVVT